MEDVLEKIRAFVLLLLTLGLLGLLIFRFYGYCVEKTKIEKEWREKVNSCLINKNFRKDCELIIYRDIQIHNQKVDSANARRAYSAGFAGGMAGGMMGASAR